MIQSKLISDPTHELESALKKDLIDAAISLKTIRDYLMSK